jgi:8-amino-7-oxononanoate synthase
MRTALRLMRAESWRRDRLAALIGRFRAGAAALRLPVLDSATPIQPLLAGSSERALAWSAQLERHGILVPAVRPPTVPEGTARLRIVLSAAHEAADVDRLLDALAALQQSA